jgi:hypothetical protein
VTVHLTDLGIKCTVNVIPQINNGYRRYSARSAAEAEHGKSLLGCVQGNPVKKLACSRKSNSRLVQEEFRKSTHVASTIQDSTVYFPDLSTYSYSRLTSLPDVLNVGWLDRSMPFSQGAVPNLFLDRLKDWFRVGRVNQMRGIHECNLCRASHWPLLPLHENPSLTIDGDAYLLGSWEIWIPSPKEVIFASPALIIHYVDTHAYRPPEEFVATVMSDKAIRKWNGEAEFVRRMTAA